MRAVGPILLLTLGWGGLGLAAVGETLIEGQVALPPAKTASIITAP